MKDLAPIQRDKFSHFFTYLLDHDRDGFINRKDFRMFSEVYVSTGRPAILSKMFVLIFPSLLKAAQKICGLVVERTRILAIDRGRARVGGLNISTEEARR